MLRKRLLGSSFFPSLAALALALVLIAVAFAISATPRLEAIRILSSAPIVFTARAREVWLVSALGALLALAYALLTVRLRRMRRLIAQGAIALRQARERWREDIAASKRCESVLAFQVSHDRVTGLATPALLRDRFHQASASAGRNGSPAWVVFIDIDQFKLVNEILNRQTGDLVLRRLSERLLAAVRESDTVARIGGDEFVLLMPEGAGEVLTATALQRVMDAVAQPISIEGREFHLSCGIGVAVYPDDGGDLDTLVKHAGIALARAKEMGRQRFQFYSPTLNLRAAERARIAVDLCDGLERDEFMLEYQPQVDLGTGQIIGMEALIRWRHPELGLLPPARFIGLAEELGLIVPIGAWVLLAACRQNKQWQDAGHARLRVAVNLSARQFHQRDLAASIAAVLDTTGLAPGDLEIELTESLVMADVEHTVGVLDSLKALGVHISIDDFGTGYSSLAYLKRFPIDSLKIDQFFVRDITSDADDALIVTSIISLAHSLRLQVTAEGVETPAQLAFLRQRGCDRMQGFHFSPAVPADAFEQLLLRHAGLPVAPGASAFRRQTLLIIDDEINVTTALHRLLRKENFAVVTVSTAMDGFAALALHDVQVILCDQRMPSMTGVDFFSKVKDLYPETIRIMLTACTERELVVDALNRGAAQRFLSKPWDDAVLPGQIRDAFRQYWLRRDGGRHGRVGIDPGADAPLPAAWSECGEAT